MRRKNGVDMLILNTVDFYKDRPYQRSFDAEVFILAAPVGPALKAQGLAPQTARTALILNGPLFIGMDTVYTPNDFIKTGRWNTDASDEGALLRWIAENRKGGLRTDELTQETLAAQGIGMTRGGTMARRNPLHTFAIRGFAAS